MSNAENYDRKNKNYSRQDLGSDGSATGDAPYKLDLKDFDVSNKSFHVSVDKNFEERYDAAVDNHGKIYRKAHKFAKLISRRYSDQNYPLHIILEKAKKYKKKYKLTESEFDAFRRIYQKVLTSTSNEYSTLYPRTIMQKVMGDINLTTNSLNVPDNELSVLQNLLAQHAEMEILHAQLINQTLQYTDCAAEALSGEYNTQRPSTSYVHPVLFALFVPKLKIIEEHMLFASIGNIVKLKHEKKPLMTNPDAELYYDIISDPNDVVCDIESPIMDLYKRMKLQHSMWINVLHLRRGSYYADELSNFLKSVEHCRLNVYDQPDFMYIRDEGSLMRRILSAFSFRPTIVTVAPVNTIVYNNPYQRSMFSGTVTTIPMISFRLPLERDMTPYEFRLDMALNQAQPYLEGNAIVPRTQSIIYSRGILIFYVNRRYQTSHMDAIFNRYGAFHRLPLTLSSFEKLNKRRVKFSESINVGDESYLLRSVVIVEEASHNENYPSIIVGTSAGVVQHTNPSINIYDDKYYIYNPAMAAKRFYDSGSNKWLNNTPVVRVYGSDHIVTKTPTDEYYSESFTERAETRGTLFIYEQEKYSWLYAKQY